MNEWIGWIIQTITMLAVGAIVYFLKEMKTNTDKRIQENKDDIHQLNKEFADLKEKLPLTYVLRDDFIRAMTNVDKKLDKIYDTITSKKGSE